METVEDVPATHSDFPALGARELVRFMADEKGIVFNRMSR